MLEKLLARICHQYRRLSYELSNVDLQSEEAFEIAQRGAVRPKVLGSPIVHDIQLLYFTPPYFNLRVTCTSENCDFLEYIYTNISFLIILISSLIRELGPMTDSVAHPISIRRTQFGPFLLPHALLEKYFQLPTIIKNIAMCNNIIEDQLAVKDDRSVS